VKVTVGPQGVIVCLVALFALIGFRRGTKRELVVLAGIALASLIANTQLEFLTVWVNRFYKIAMFVAKGGLSEDLGSVSLGSLEPLVQTNNDSTWLAVTAYAVIVILSYLVGQRGIKGSPARSERVLGGLIGGVNGFLINRFIYPRVFPVNRTHVAIMSGQVSDALTGNSLLPLVLVGLVMILVVYGVRGSSRSSGNG